MADEHSPLTAAEQLLADRLREAMRLLQTSLREAGDSAAGSPSVRTVLALTRQAIQEVGSEFRGQVLDDRLAEALRKLSAVVSSLEVLYGAPIAASGAPLEEDWGAERGLSGWGGTEGWRSIESADAALKRAAEPEIVNEILAGGAVAASFTAAASVAKAKLEATTQRRKNDLDAETERLRIASEERIAGFQAMSGQVEPEAPSPDEA
ncbi:hypothetical protein [Streptomyces sp. NPDC102360]|uniref:hypothetical protein n=1 Tax=Streptomyces sp. NPDC102360 TaxID=3366160 RepID=UPI0037F9C8C0